MKKMFPLFTPPLARLHNPTGAHDATDPPGSTLSLLASIVLATEPIGGAVAPPIGKITRTNTLLHLWRRLNVRLVAPAHQWPFQIKPPSERQKAQGVQHGDGVPRRRQRAVGRPLF